MRKSPRDTTSQQGTESGYLLLAFGSVQDEAQRAHHLLQTFYCNVSCLMRIINVAQHAESCYKQSARPRCTSLEWLPRSQSRSLR